MPELFAFLAVLVSALCVALALQSLAKVRSFARDTAAQSAAAEADLLEAFEIESAAALQFRELRSSVERTIPALGRISLTSGTACAVSAFAVARTAGLIGACLAFAVGGTGTLLIGLIGQKARSAFQSLPRKTATTHRMFRHRPSHPQGGAGIDKARLSGAQIGGYP